mmetsp:Transcript_10260/g.24112  ORF Transcript_10260/g.24112 Transcript_10260/m.24112 type:complete len:461 (+) Transcript_10260:306-1688(+)
MAVTSRSLLLLLLGGACCLRVNGRLGHASLVLKRHVVGRRQRHARAEDVLDAAALREERVHHGRARRHEGRLDQVREQRHDGMEVRPLRELRRLVLDARGHVSENGEVEDEGRGQQGVLARVVHDDGLDATHEDVGCVLVHRALAVAHLGHVLDHDHVVGVLVLVVKDAIRADHVVDDVGLGDLLGAERLRRLQVLAVVVAQVVVRDDGGRLDAGGHEEVDHDRLHLGLPRLEVIAADHDVVPLGELDHARHEGVLRRAVDVHRPLEHRGDGEDGGGRDLGLIVLDGLQQVVGAVVDTGLEGGEAFCVGRPQHDDLVEFVSRLEVANVLADLVEVLLLVLAGQHVGRAVGLVGGDEVGVVDRGQRLHVLHQWLQLLLQPEVEHLRAAHGLGEVVPRDVPASEHDVVRVHHRQQRREGDVHVRVVMTGAPEPAGGGLREGAEVVGLVLAFFGLPLHLMLVR